MPEITPKKLRIVKLLEILQQNTDMEHPISTNKLCSKLAELGIPASVYTNGIDVITDSPVISETDLGSATLDERAVMLARIDLKKQTVPFAETLEKYIPATDSDDFILLISPQFNGSFRSVLTDIKARRPSLQWLMPCYRTTPDADPEPSVADSYIRWEVIGND